MKIVLVSPIPPPEGGIATWTKDFTAFCASRNCNISLVNTALIGTRCKNFNSKTTLHDELKRTRKILKSMSFALKDKTVDIVHINSSCSAKGILRDYLCARIAEKHKIPIIFHCRCNVQDAITSSFSKYLFRKIQKIASNILVLNERSNRYVKELTGTTPIIVPNFVKDDQIYTNRIINKEIKNIVFIGHVQEEKGCLEILKAAESFPEKHFILVGPIEDKICNENIPQNVYLTGGKSFEEAQEYLTKSDIFLFPSYTEGFSLSLVEAMASGLPCIATNVGSNADMLENLGGIIIPPKNVSAIVDAIKKIDKYEIRKEMSEWNIKKVKNNYTIERVVNQIFEIYKNAKKI